MADQQYIYRGVAGFDGGGTGGLSSLCSPWMESVQEVEEFVRQHFSSIPTTWYINRQNSEEPASGVRNVRQFTIKPREEDTRDTYVLLREDLTLIAVGSSIDELHKHVINTGKYISNLRLKIYHAPTRNADLKHMDLVESFTPDDLRSESSQLRNVPEENLVEYLESLGYSVRKKN